VAREAEKHARDAAAAEKKRAEDASLRASDSDAKRAEADLALRDAEARVAAYASDTTAATLATKLEEKESVLEAKTLELAAATNEISAMRAELSAQATHATRLAAAADVARADAERARDEAREGSEEYRILASKATEAAREAAAAQAAAALSREISQKTQTDVAAWIERERIAKDELADARVKHATVSQQFKDADEKLTETKQALSRTAKKAEEMERAHRDGEEIRRRLADELRRTRETAKAAYASWQQTAGQLEDTRRVLEREQENSIRMHQGSATRKLQLAGAAAGGLALGDAGQFSTKSRNVLEDRVHTETRMLLGAGTDSASVATGHDRSSKPTMAIAGPTIPSLEMLMPTLAQTATAPSTPRAPNSVVEPE
jgi:chromosome segregation ATPase